MLKHFLLSVFRSKNAIKIGIVLIVILVLHNFFVTLYSTAALKERNNFVQKRLVTLNSIDNIGTNVNLIDLGLRGYYMVPEDNFKVPFESGKKQHRLNMDSLTVRMADLGYPHMDSLAMIDRWITEYAKLADKGISMIKDSLITQTASMYEKDPGYTLWSKYSKIQTSMRNYVNEMEAESLQKYKRINLYAFFSQLLLVCLGGTVMTFVFVRLIKHDNYIKRMFHTIQESDRNYIFDSGEEIQEKDNEEVILHMTQNLKKATEFIQKITKGDLDVEWKGLNKSNASKNKNTLSGELITMRDQMHVVKLEEGNRMWVSEGISKFSEIVRTDQEDLKLMSDRLLSGIVKYMGCNQGGMFFVDTNEEGQRQLLLTSCFAYDKKKIKEKSVPVDVGLLGQAFTEGEMVILKEIPENYIHITSGLGEAVPQFLVIVPLKVNDVTEGVMELASFEPFSEVQQELLMRISEIVASAVFASRNAEKMKILLEQAQQTTEEMRAQEEEMRQNMEELQATQEEMARNEKENTKRIQELEALVEKVSD